MIQDFDEYQRRASRTMANNEGDENLRLSVWALGLAGEATEVLGHILQVDPSSTLTKELGDVCWYVAALCTHFDISLGDVVGHKDFPSFLTEVFDGPHRPYAHLKMIVVCGGVADYIKKVIGHGHLLDVTPLREDLKEVMACIAEVAEAHDLRLEDVLDANIQKLEKRYKDGFSTEASQSRVDEALS